MFYFQYCFTIYFYYYYYYYLLLLLLLLLLLFIIITTSAGIKILEKALEWKKMQLQKALTAAAAGGNLNDDAKDVEDAMDDAADADADEMRKNIIAAQNVLVSTLGKRKVSEEIDIDEV